MISKPNELASAGLDLPTKPTTTAPTPEILEVPSRMTHEDYRYRTLVRLACSLNSENDLDKLLDMILRETNPLLDAERASLFLVDHDTQQIYSVVALGIGRQIRLPIGTGLAGIVAKTGEVINVRDTRSDPRFYKDIDVEGGYITRNILTMPLRSHSNKIIGVIQAINKRHGYFYENDEEVLEAFASISAVSIENATLRRDIERMFNSFVKTMAKTIDARSPQTAGHSGRVAFYAQKVALKLGLGPERAHVVYLAGLLHDFGKIGVPEAILTKPGKLDDGEWVAMRKHVVQTKDILSNMYFIGELKRIPLIAGQHHERINGKGYPLGLTGDMIELEAKILAVCDVYDAITVKRYYRDPMSAGDALQYMSKLIDIEFDRDCIQALIDVVEEYGAPRNPDQDTAEQFNGVVTNPLEV
ncbi:MAG TPA: HD domain-containing phosphohydrolase [Chloroflexia bacterium]|nr:HD domain-containing phosphohydrolase [Chloroflexia bacterium]